MTDQPTGPADWTPAHYRGDGLQPFDVINAFGLDFYEGNALKYLLRWRKKNGVEDLCKARTYLQVLIDRATGTEVVPDPAEDIDDWGDAPTPDDDYRRQLAIAAELTAQFRRVADVLANQPGRDAYALAPTPADDQADASPTGDNGLREQYAAAIRTELVGLRDDVPASLDVATAVLAIRDRRMEQLLARIATLEHVAQGNKRHVQIITPELDQAQTAIARVRAIKKSPSRSSSNLLANAQDDGWDQALDAVHAALRDPLTPADGEQAAPIDWEAIARQRERELREIGEARHAAEAARDGAYRERAQLIAYLAAIHPSHIGHTDPNAPDWAVVIVETPAGQMSWHVAARDMDLFEHVELTSRTSRAWDGHSTEMKYERLRKLIARIIRPTRA